MTTHVERASRFTERELLTGPAFRPWDRFWMLDRLCEEVPPERAAEVLPLVTSTAMVVIRHVLGRVTDAEAFAHIDRARLAIMKTRRP